MRNLRSTKHTRFKFSSEATKLSAVAWDASDDSLILAFGPDDNSQAITLKRLSSSSKNPEDAELITSWDAPSPSPDLAVDRILDLSCFPDTRTINLVLAGGDILKVREIPQVGEDLIEIVGSVDAGICAAAWSPDEELVAIFTGADTLLFMTRDFESIASITLSIEDLKVSNHVSVGWGKKETQFKGRGVAKTLRDPTVPEHIDEGILCPLDDGKTTISWRGDGQYVAINTILDIEQKRRVIRVYSREGTLESVSEPMNGLEGALSWMPSGQIIAGVRRQEQKIDVVFFERNGLRHGEFSLRLNREEMATSGRSIDLKWNVDSSVLAVSMKDRVQLWTMGNYHYYLKQEILLNNSSLSVAQAIWHPEKPLQLYCLNDTNLRQLLYTFEVCRGSVTPPNDNGLVAVIDGKKLKVTPLRTANVPPPMALDEVELPNNAIDVAINESCTEIAVLHDGSVSVWDCEYNSKPVRRATLRATIKTPQLHYPDEANDSIKIHEVDGLFVRTDHDRIHYAVEQHKIDFRFTDNGLLVVQSDQQTLRIPCTSFIVTPNHLIYTSGQHLLKFVHLQDGELEVPPDEPEKDERCRSIERGARIVTVMPSAYSLVLQMPRGNLETIYPRALVLASIRQSINDRDYKRAFLTCRTQRVDMNILHDYAPEQFMRDVEIFLKQVNKVEYVDLFLSSLLEDDVSQVLYRETLAPKEKPTLSGALISSSKVNSICDAFLRALQGAPQPAGEAIKATTGTRGASMPTLSTRGKFQNIVTAHVCKNPPDLEAGLSLVSDLRREGNQEQLERAVEHICFLADVNQLYDTALGLYDLEVALLVAQQSQKDPREYLPYLQSLQDLQPLRRNFTIDNDLKRYQKALTHLHALQAFEELKSYVSKHELYAAAIEHYRYDHVRLKELMRLHADYLFSRNQFKEAGIAYEYIADHASACEAFRSSSTWRECLANAIMTVKAADELMGLARDLADSLVEAKQFSDAATIHLDYMDDLEGSARLRCKAYEFGEAMRQVTLRQRSELIESVIDPGLIEASATMTELLAEMKSQLSMQVPRLKELRQKKADDPMAFLDGVDGGDADIPDNLSLAPTDVSTSGGTFMTRYTNRSMGTLATNATRKTSKNRRREERKRARGKKGTVYEEEYLINSIARLIERLNDTGDDVSRLIEGLTRRSMRERAVAVQTAMEAVVNAITSSQDEVFISTGRGTEEDSQDLPDGDGLSRPWGRRGVLWNSLMSPRQEAPTLKKFERLVLIS